MESNLKELEDRNQALIDGLTETGIGLDIVDQDFNIIYQNDVLKNLYGDIRGRKCFEFYLNRTKPCKTCSMCRAIRNNRLEKDIIKTDEGRIFEILSTPLKNSEGYVDRVLEVIIDITEKVITNEKLIESEEKYRTLFESANDVIFLIDGYKFIDANDYVREMFGIDDKNQLTGLAPWDLSPPQQPDGRESREKARDLIDKCLNGESQRFYWKYRKMDGSLIDVEVSLNRLMIENKYLTQAIVRDITEYLLDEQKVRESEEKYRTIAEQSVVGISIIQDNHFRYVNQFIADLIGYPREEILNWEAGHFVDVIHPDYRTRVIEIAKMKQYDRTSEPLVEEFEVLRSTGEIIWTQAYITTIIFNGRPAEMNISIDISKRKKAEQLIIEENRKLMELDKMRMDIITRISHELRTPLTSIFGATELLISELKDKVTEKEGETLDFLHKGCIRLNDLVINIEDILKMDENNFKTSPKNVDIIKIIRDSVKELNYLIDMRNHKIELKIPDHFNLKADEFRISQAIKNLLSNAIKNTPHNGIITVEFDEKDKYNDISIKDTGVGLTESELSKLFKKFGKIERYGMNLDVDIEGSGLGLYISKKIVEMHGGTILVKSEGRNKGSTFTIRLYKFS